MGGLSAHLLGGPWPSHPSGGPRQADWSPVGWAGLPGAKCQNWEIFNFGKYGGWPGHGPPNGQADGPSNGWTDGPSVGQAYGPPGRQAGPSAILPIASKEKLAAPHANAAVQQPGTAAAAATATAAGATGKFFAGKAKNLKNSNSL